MCKAYNGWTNYPTWCVHLWLTNDERSYNQFRDLAKNYQGKEGGKWEFADAIKEAVEEGNPLLDRQADLYLDLISSISSSGGVGTNSSMISGGVI